MLFACAIGLAFHDLFVLLLALLERGSIAVERCRTVKLPSPSVRHRATSSSTGRATGGDVDEPAPTLLNAKLLGGRRPWKRARSSLPSFYSKKFRKMQTFESK
jgi:hypothetical protein